MLPDVLPCGCAMNWDALHALVVTEALQHATSRSSTDAMGLYDLDEQLAALLNNVLGANFSVSPGLHGLAARLAQLEFMCVSFAISNDPRQRDLFPLPPFAHVLDSGGTGDSFSAK